MSKQMLRNAKYSVHQLIKKDKTLSFNTRANYKHILFQCLDELYALGIQLPNISNLKQKHIKQLIFHWQEKCLSAGTQKNLLASIRFALRQLGHEGRLPKSNDALGIKKRCHRPRYNRAITTLVLDEIDDPYIAFSLRLQQAFGLRRQESIKFIVSLADKGNHLALTRSWTKGGVPRTVPITTETQRQLLTELHDFCDKGQALIPLDSTYERQLYRYVTQVRAAGMRNVHGLRHAYAQRRYRELTHRMSQGHGWAAPIEKDGIPKNKLSDNQKKIDRWAREIIAAELGHGRISVLKSYLL